VGGHGGDDGERRPGAVVSGATPERRLPCGCYAIMRQGNERVTYEITGEAFICERKHKQGAIVDEAGVEVPSVHPDQITLA